MFVVLLMASTAFAESVNAVIGDDSWVARYGRAPDARDAEDDRIRVHLEHVEARLRASAPAGLTAAQRAARAQNLARLRAYIERGEFPRNHEVAGRRPHFIDDDGRICAVGYLIEQSAGRAVVEAINARHEWDYIPAIRGIDAWVEASGLTREELAMIQPAYGWRPRPVPPPPVDEGEQRRRVVLSGLAGVEPAVQACAARYGVTRWLEDIRVAVTLRRFAVDVRVPRIGRRGFQRCVHGVVHRVVARSYFTWRTAPLTIPYAFVLAPPRHGPIDGGDDGRWAQPPPS